MHYVYILRCSDGTYYIGSTTDLEARLAEHAAGVHPNAYTATRRPVEMVWSESFDSHEEAFLFERRIKGWSRRKKAALIRGDLDEVHGIVTQERIRREHPEHES